MIEIGKTKVVVVRRKGKVVTGADNEPETKIMESIVQRITRQEYGHNSRYSRRLIVRLHGEDTLTIRPTGLRTESLIVSVNIGQLYKELLTRRCQREALIKAREKKERMKERRQIRNMRAKERRFTRKLKAENAQ